MRLTSEDTTKLYDRFDVGDYLLINEEYEGIVYAKSEDSIDILYTYGDSDSQLNSAAIRAYPVLKPFVGMNYDAFHIYPGRSFTRNGIDSIEVLAPSIGGE